VYLLQSYAQWLITKIFLDSLIFRILIKNRNQYPDIFLVAHFMIHDMEEDVMHSVFHFQEVPFVASGATIYTTEQGRPLKKG
jgi:hypothetical protein